MMEEVKVEKFKRDRAMIATAIIVAVVALAAFNVFPIMVSAIIGAILMVATGCLTIKDAYDNVDWMVIFLLAGMIPLGIALEKTGAAGAAANWFVRLFDSFGTFGVLSALYIATALLTSVLTNNATAVLLAPIAISMALSLGMNPKPFLFVVMFAASASFITPIGYQTNTLVYGPGRYRFFDYFKIGAPINLIAWLVVTLLVPIFWPLR